MVLRRGFKSAAAALAREVRTELRLGPLDRLDPRELAEHLAIPIVPLSELAAASIGAQYLLSVGRDAFSGLTVFEGHRRIIVHNDSHSEARQSSNLAHELAHGLLLHEPIPALDGMTGCRNWKDTNEEEADWLSGEMLVTSDMAMTVAQGRITEQEAQQRFGVSAAMLKWRINKTGARKRVERRGGRPMASYTPPDATPQRP